MTLCATGLPPHTTGPTPTPHTRKGTHAHFHTPSHPPSLTPHPIAPQVHGHPYAPGPSRPSSSSSQPPAALPSMPCSQPMALSWAACSHSLP